MLLLVTLLRANVLARLSLEKVTPDLCYLDQALERHYVPLRLLVVAATRKTAPHNTLLIACHFESSIPIDAQSHMVLLSQANEQHKLVISADGIEKGHSYSSLKMPW